MLSSGQLWQASLLSPFLAWQKYLPLFRTACIPCHATFPLLHCRLNAIYLLAAEAVGECNKQLTFPNLLGLNLFTLPIKYLVTVSAKSFPPPRERSSSPSSVDVLIFSPTVCKVLYFLGLILLKNLNSDKF